MEIFSLPNSTKVNRVVPKNAFDKYTTNKQKKLLSDYVARIVWTNKLSVDTVNLASNEISEIQIFTIELKSKTDVRSILDIIDKSISYHIVFVIRYGLEIYLSASSKHSNPANEDHAVIDWTFKSDWFPISENTYQFNLKRSIDTVFHDFCQQINGEMPVPTRSIGELVTISKNAERLRKEIEKIRAAIAKCRQFKLKVELNLKLKAAESELRELMDADD